tara:strand:+ start:675 stop:911 length:237 start_codon:yes stop_codon:yes gene_type:complete
MEENKGKPKKSAIRWILFVLFHLGFIGSSFVLLYQTGHINHVRSETDMIFNVGYAITASIGMHFFGCLLYKEYTREDK